MTQRKLDLVMVAGLMALVVVILLLACPAQAAMETLDLVPEGQTVQVMVVGQEPQEGQARRMLDLDGRWPTQSELEALADGEWTVLSIRVQMDAAGLAGFRLAADRAGVVLGTCDEIDRCLQRLKGLCPNSCVLSASVAKGCEGTCCDKSTAVVVCAEAPIKPRPRS